MAKKGLGKGLGAIFGEDVVKENKEETEKKAKAEAKAAEEMDEKGRILMLKLDLVQPNKEQPRKTFDEEKINELAESIKIMECCSHYWCRKTIAFMRSLQEREDGVLQRQLG